MKKNEVSFVLGGAMASVSIFTAKIIELQESKVLTPYGQDVVSEFYSASEQIVKNLNSMHSVLFHGKGCEEEIKEASYGIRLTCGESMIIPLFVSLCHSIPDVLESCNPGNRYGAVFNWHLSHIKEKASYLIKTALIEFK